MGTERRFTIARKSRSARSFFKRLSRQEQDRVRQAVRKICDNPWRDHRRHAIRYLKGDWEGYLEFRSNTRPIFRIIYRITDDRTRLFGSPRKASPSVTSVCHPIDLGP